MNNFFPYTLSDNPFVQHALPRLLDLAHDIPIIVIQPKANTQNTTPNISNNSSPLSKSVHDNPIPYNSPISAADTVFSTTLVHNTHRMVTRVKAVSSNQKLSLFLLLLLNLILLKKP